MAEENTTGEGNVDQPLDLTDLPKETSTDEELLAALGLGDDTKEESDESKNADTSGDEASTGDEESSSDADDEELVDDLVELFFQDEAEEAEKEPLLLKDDEKDADDSELADKAVQAASYQDYLRLAKEQGVELSDRWLAMAARQQADPQFLAERGIFDFDSLRNYAERTESQLDPERVFFPKDDDSEDTWNAFREKEFNIPSSVDGYAEVFEGEDYSPEQIEGYSDFFAQHLLSMEQAKGFVDYLSQMESAEIEEREESLRSRRKREFGLMKDTYGERYQEEVGELYALVNKVAPDFFKEHRGSDVVQSSSFLNMIRDLRDAKLDVAENVDLSKYRRSISSIPNDKLDQLMDTVARNPKSDNRFANSGNRADRDEHEKLNRQFAALFEEKERRQNLGIW